MRRSYLLLQGPATPFFHRLGLALEAAGHRVVRLHFCAGDVLYGGLAGARLARVPMSALPQLLSELYRLEGVTDQVLFGDRRAVHRPAIELGAALGVRTHVFEEGYFRPWWVTLERGGVNAHSPLPRDPAWFREVGRSLPEPEWVRFDNPFWRRAVYDVAYHAAGLLNPVLFPRYRNHAPPAPLEYAGYAWRLPRVRLSRPREQRRLEALLGGERPYFLLPLQLDTDAQIRDHSPFANMREVIDHVLASFARHAPSQARLVVKNHPLDTGLAGHARWLKRTALRWDVADRVLFLEEGDLVRLVRHARGVVTVNSTAGLVALEHGAPTLALSRPIYDLPGLTAGGDLASFWQEPVPPEPVLFAAFRRVVLHAAQINGGFYSPQGMALAVHNAVATLTARRSALEEWLGCSGS